MRFSLFLLLLFLQLGISPLVFLYSSQTESQQLLSSRRLSIRNEILFKVNGKPVTTFDILRRMDQVFDEEYPTYREVPEARYQFYVSHWNEYIHDVENRALVLEDAREKKVDIPEGDVREQMMSLYGPHIRQTLARREKSFKDVWEEVKNDLIVQNMLSLPYLQAEQSITPQMILEEYYSHLERFYTEKQWEYCLLVVHASHEERGADLVQEVEKLLQEEISVEEVVQVMNQKLAKEEETSLTLSPLYQLYESEISEKHKSILRTLNEEKSSSFYRERVEQEKEGYVVKMFFLKKYTPSHKIAYGKEVEDLIHRELSYQLHMKEREKYFAELRSRFPVEVVTDGADPHFFFL